MLAKLKLSICPQNLLKTMPGMKVRGTSLHPKEDVRDLGVTIDKHLKVTEHVNNTSKSASYAIKNIGKVRKYL